MITAFFLLFILGSISCATALESYVRVAIAFPTGLSFDVVLTNFKTGEETLFPKLSYSNVSTWIDLPAEDYIYSAHYYPSGAVILNGTLNLPANRLVTLVLASSLENNTNPIKLYAFFEDALLTSETKSGISVYHFCPDSGAVDVVVNGVVLISNFTYLSSAQATISSKATDVYTISVKRTGTQNLVVKDSSIPLPPQRSFAIFVFGLSLSTEYLAHSVAVFDFYTATPNEVNPCELTPSPGPTPEPTFAPTPIPENPKYATINFNFNGMVPADAVGLC